MDFTYQTHHLAVKGGKTKGLTTATSEIFIVIEGLPKVVNGFVSGFSTGVNENTYLRLIKA